MTTRFHRIGTDARPPPLRLALSAALALAVWYLPALAVRQRTLPGPVAARVIEVLDGDTLLVEARIWLDQWVTTRVRLAGVDAPELHGACAAERAAAVAARAFLGARLAQGGTAGGTVSLRDIRYGKYAGRILARVSTAGGEDLSAALVAAGHARPYRGRRRKGWCDAPTVQRRQ
jgi:endonuclease YncB( thermonuclease family)